VSIMIRRRDPANPLRLSLFAIILKHRCTQPRQACIELALFVGKDL
jgi:hypothetical protein